MSIIAHKIIESGQLRAYADSRTIIHMQTDPCTADEAWALSQTIQCLLAKLEERRK